MFAEVALGGGGGCDGGGRSGMVDGVAQPLTNSFVEVWCSLRFTANFFCTFFVCVCCVNSKTFSTCSLNALYACAHIYTARTHEGVMEERTLARDIQSTKMCSCNSLIHANSVLFMLIKVLGAMPARPWPAGTAISSRLSTAPA